jgi:hypothetical protein
MRTACSTRAWLPHPCVLFSLPAAAARPAHLVLHKVLHVFDHIQALGGDGVQHLAIEDDGPRARRRCRGLSHNSLHPHHRRPRHMTTCNTQGEHSEAALRHPALRLGSRAAAKCSSCHDRRDTCTRCNVTHDQSGVTRVWAEKAAGAAVGVARALCTRARYQCRPPRHGGLVEKHVMIRLAPCGGAGSKCYGTEERAPQAWVSTRKSRTHAPSARRALLLA